MAEHPKRLGPGIVDFFVRGLTADLVPVDRLETPTGYQMGRR